MARELYQLVAFSSGIEYVIDLNNDNKNNRGSLEFIDSGTSRFPSEKKLAEYLYENGKIPTKNVKFAIKYMHEGPKYLPVVINDLQIAALTNSDNQKLKEMALLQNMEVDFGQYVFRLVARIETEMFNKEFYKTLLSINSKSKKRYRSGNYLNSKLMRALNEYFTAFVLPNDDYSNRTEIRLEILNELYSYKQLRTMHLFYNEYILKHKEKEDNIVIGVPNYEELPDIPDYIASAYRYGGLDEVYSVADLDDLESKRIRFR